MSLTPAEQLELHDLEARSYGKDEGRDLSSVQTRRLADLQARKNASADLDESATPEPVHASPHRTGTGTGTGTGTVHALVAGAVGFVIGAAFALVIWQISSTTAGASEPQGEWDPGSVHYLGSYRDADFSLPTRERGDTTCLIAESLTDQTIYPGVTCKPTESALRTGLAIGGVTQAGPHETATLRLFTVTLLPDGATLMMSETPAP